VNALNLHTETISYIRYIGTAIYSPIANPSKCLSLDVMHNFLHGNIARYKFAGYCNAKLQLTLVGFAAIGYGKENCWQQKNQFHFVLSGFVSYAK